MGFPGAIPKYQMRVEDHAGSAPTRPVRAWRAGVVLC